MHRLTFRAILLNLAIGVALSSFTIMIQALAAPPQSNPTSQKHPTYQRQYPPSQSSTDPECLQKCRNRRNTCNLTKWTKAACSAQFGACQKACYSRSVADLVPLPIEMPVGTVLSFCNRKVDNTGLEKLVVIVKNQGGADAPASTTIVSFYSGVRHIGSVDLQTPAIPAGGSISLSPIVIPPECYHPSGCEFWISVDRHHAVNESNEENNHVKDRCVS